MLFSLNNRYSPDNRATEDTRIIVHIIGGSLNIGFSPINTGYAPVSRARQVNPKAKPGLPGRIFDNATSVTGIVILNRNRPGIAR